MKKCVAKVGRFFKRNSKIIIPIIILSVIILLIVFRNKLFFDWRGDFLSGVFIAAISGLISLIIGFVTIFIALTARSINKKQIKKENICQIEFDEDYECIYQNLDANFFKNYKEICLGAVVLSDLPQGEFDNKINSCTQKIKCLTISLYFKDLFSHTKDIKLIKAECCNEFKESANFKNFYKEFHVIKGKSDKHLCSIIPAKKLRKLEMVFDVNADYWVKLSSARVLVFNLSLELTNFLGTATTVEYVINLASNSVCSKQSSSSGQTKLKIDKFKIKNIGINDIKYKD